MRLAPYALISNLLFVSTQPNSVPPVSSSDRFIRFLSCLMATPTHPPRGCGAFSAIFGWLRLSVVRHLLISMENIVESSV